MFYTRLRTLLEQSFRLILCICLLSAQILLAAPLLHSTSHHELSQETSHTLPATDLAANSDLDDRSELLLTVLPQATPASESILPTLFVQPPLQTSKSGVLISHLSRPPPSLIIV